MRLVANTTETSHLVFLIAKVEQSLSWKCYGIGVNFAEGQTLWSKRPCPTCHEEGSKPWKGKHVSASRPAEQMDWDSVKNSFVGLRAEQVFFSFYRCEFCGQLYSPMYFSNIQLQELYLEMPNNLMGENVGTASKTQFGYAEQILTHKKDAISYLEMGPDIGLLAKRIAQRTQNISAVLIEPNVAVHKDIYTNTLNFKTVEIINNLNEIEKVETKNYDLLVGVHVLDHLLDPTSELRTLSKLSGRKANLCLVVHNEKSLLARLLRKAWPPYCLQHPQLYNRDTIKQVLNKNGWEVLSIKRTKNYYTSRNLLKMFCSITHLPQFFSNAIPNFEIPIYLGNILIVAQKSEELEF